MTKAEIAEIRGGLSPSKQEGITVIRGCYVGDEKRIVALLNSAPALLPEEEMTKYLALFKRALGGVPGKNLTDVPYTTQQVMEGEPHRLLMALRSSALKDDDSVQAFYRQVIDNLQLEGRYLILLLHNELFVPYRGGERAEPTAEEGGPSSTFSHILCAICPVKQLKPALSYYSEDQEFHSRSEEWVVAAPETGFLFPAFDDRAANIHSLLYYARDLEQVHDEFVTSALGAELPMPAVEQKEAFQSLLAEALGEDCSFEVAQIIHEQVRDMMETQKKDKAAPVPMVTKREVAAMLESGGVPEDRLKQFEERYDDAFGEAAAFVAPCIVDEKKFELRTADVVIHVSPDKSDLIETRVIDGRRYILIPAEEGVEVNGMRVSISEG